MENISKDFGISMNRLQQLIEETRPTRGLRAYYTEKSVSEWLELLAEKILDEVVEVIHDSDPSPQMIVHEPYRTAANNVVGHFYNITESTDEHNT